MSTPLMPGICTSVIRHAVSDKRPEARNASADSKVAVAYPRDLTSNFAASRTDFDSPWVNWTAESIRKTTGKAPAVLPNFGGSLPNDVFSDTLGLPTMWVPHSYPGCSQHAPDEHILLSVTEEALGIMAGLFWDLGEMPRPL